MRLAVLAAAGDISVGSLFQPGPDGNPVLADASTVDAVPHETADISTELANARAAGLSHLRIAGSNRAPILDPSRPGIVTVRGLYDGRLALDVAVLANLSLDPHPPGPHCFESYELVELGELLTPDLFVDQRDGDMSIIAMYGFVDRERLDGLIGEPILTVQVSCAGRPGEPSAVDYPVQWLGRLGPQA